MTDAMSNGTATGRSDHAIRHTTRRSGTRALSRKSPIARPRGNTNLRHGTLVLRLPPSPPPLSGSGFEDIFAWETPEGYIRSHMYLGVGFAASPNLASDSRDLREDLSE